MTTFRGTLVRSRFLPPSRRCRPPPSFIRISSFPLSHSIHFQSKLPIYRRCCEREESLPRFLLPFLQNRVSDKVERSFTQFRDGWMDGWMDGFWVGRASRLSLTLSTLSQMRRKGQNGYWVSRKKRTSRADKKNPFSESNIPSDILCH